MKLWSTNCLLLSLILLHHCCMMEAGNPSPPRYCEAVDGRCHGQMLFQHGRIPTDIIANNTQATADGMECNQLCRNTSWCYMVEFSASVRTCRLFPTLNFSTRMDAGVPAHLIYYWDCCSQTDSCTSVPGHCPGYWVGYVGKRLTRFISGPIEEINSTTNHDCRSACLNNQLCLYANYQQFDDVHGLCELYSDTVEQTVDQLVTINKENAELFRWMCCDSWWETLLSNSQCQSSYVEHLKCSSGYWQQTTTSAAMPTMLFRIVGDLFTFNITNCPHECQLNPFCNRVFYLPHLLTCLLTDETSNGSSSLLTYSSQHLSPKSPVITWTWNCCRPLEDLAVPPEPSTCLCITDAKEVAVDANLFENLEKGIHIAFNGSAFLYDKGRNRRFISNESVWLPVTNGIENLWLNPGRQISEWKWKAIETCPMLQCQLYSGRIVKYRQHLEIVNRQQWHAEKPREPFVPLGSLAKYVIILNTVTPGYRCFSLLTCSSYVRGFHSYHRNSLNWNAIGYNFLIGDDGRVYEGRGWNMVGAHTKSYNTVSLGIAFIGWFEHESPTLAAVDSAKQLIEYAQNNSLIDPKYVLLAHRDVRSSFVPGSILHHIMYNWPHYQRRTPTVADMRSEMFVEDSHDYLLSILLKSLFPIILLIIVVGISSAVIYRRFLRHTEACRHLLSCIHQSRKLILVSCKHQVNPLHLWTFGTLPEVRDTQWTPDIQSSSLETWLLINRKPTCSGYHSLPLLLLHLIDADVSFGSPVSVHSAQSDEPTCHMILLYVYPKSLIEKTTCLVIHVSNAQQFAKIIDQVSHAPRGCLCRCARLTSIHSLVGPIDNWISQMPSVPAVTGFSMAKYYRQYESFIRRRAITLAASGAYMVQFTDCPSSV